jgi:hypothetical protein
MDGVDSKRFERCMVLEVVPFILSCAEEIRHEGNRFQKPNVRIADNYVFAVTGTAANPRYLLDTGLSYKSATARTYPENPAASTWKPRDKRHGTRCNLHIYNNQNAMAEICNERRKC